MPQLIQFFRSSYKSLSWDLFLDRAIKLAVSEKREKEGRVRKGWDEREGQHWSGPGLECSIEVWCFDGKLWQSGANCSNSGRERGPGPDQTVERERGRKSSKGGRDKQPRGSGTLSDIRPFLSKDLPKLKRKENSEQ